MGHCIEEKKAAEKRFVVDVFQCFYFIINSNAMRFDENSVMLVKKLKLYQP